MKPLPLVMKAGMVVGLGGFALANPTPAAALRGCVFVVNECPVDLNWICYYHGCIPTEPICAYRDGALRVMCEGSEQ